MTLLKGYLMPHPPIIIPEIGGKDLDQVSNTVQSMRKVSKEIALLEPETIIVITPHGFIFSDAITVTKSEKLSGDFRHFRAPKVVMELDIDTELIEEIITLGKAEGIPAFPFDRETAKKYGMNLSLDHGTMVPLYYVRDEYKKIFKLVHVSIGMLSYEELYKFGIIMREAIIRKDRRTVVIASGDLSHRLKPGAPSGYNPKGKEFDQKLVKLIEEFKVFEIVTMDRGLIEEAGECGFRSLVMLLGCFDGMDVDSKVYSYEGPFGVGYCIASFMPLKSSDDRKLLEKLIHNKNERIRKIREKEDEYTKLARKSLEYYIRTGKIMPVSSDLPKEMLERKAGVFVSIKKNGELRGCIGTVFPTKPNIALEIIHNAISAGCHDPRFFPVEEDELDELIYSVDILTEPVPVKDLSELDPKRYGVIVRKGGRSGLLLPDLEGIETAEEQIRIALRKAGINENENYTIEKFEVVRHR